MIDIFRPTNLEREFPIPIEGNPEDYRKFASFGFVRKKMKVIFEP